MIREISDSELLELFNDFKLAELDFEENRGNVEEYDHYRKVMIDAKDRFNKLLKESRKIG